MSAHTDLILSIISQQGPLEQSKNAVERELADLRAAGGFRENKERVLELNRKLTEIIKRLSILHKAEVLATKKAMEEISGDTYKITLADVEEVGGTEDELDELNKLLSGLMSSRRGRKNKSRKSRKNKSRKSRKNKSRN
jgi:hypothetical protein